MAELTDEERAKIQLATDLRPLWSEGPCKSALITFLQAREQEELDEIQDILAAIGAIRQDGHRVLLTADNNRELEFCRVRQRIWREEFVSELTAIVQEAAQITGAETLADFEMTIDQPQ